MEPEVEINIFKNIRDLSLAATNLFIESASQAIAKRGRSLVALSGGNTPTLLYQTLAGAPYRNQINWAKVHVFWGDERCVPPDDPGNCYYQAKLALLDHVDIPADNIHRISSELEPAAAAADYARTLKVFSTLPLEWPLFDLVLLGMGEDGHTASLFPGSPVNMTSPTVAVTANYQDRPARRVSLTLLVFNSARQIVFLVSGGSKSETLANVLNGEDHPELYPAQRIRPTDGEVIWLVDEAAAKNITSKKQGV
ncbi:MAG: 6-phosphogluconolactonase [Anaerolineales bacterium]|nr:6-phosphogluconolactonase [Anaerolineales bacterium]